MHEARRTCIPFGHLSDPDLRGYLWILSPSSCVCQLVGLLNAHHAVLSIPDFNTFLRLNIVDWRSFVSQRVDLLSYYY
jgi:hypothetical protein